MNIEIGMGHTCKNIIPYEHKKNWNRAVARFQFFFVKATKGKCPILIFLIYIPAKSSEDW